MSKGLASAAVTSIGRHSLVYGAGAVIPFVIGMVNIAVLTRFIAPSAFGQLAVLLIFGGSLTILYTLGTLQGTYRLVYGGDGEEEIDDLDDVAVVSDKGRVLSTGIALVALVSLLGTVAIVLSAGWFTRILFLDESQTGLVILAATSGALGAVWRIVINIPRLERRPKTYAGLNGVRPTLAVALSILLVTVADAGIGGVLVGISVGTAVATVLGLTLCRDSIVPAFRTDYARDIVRGGRMLIPIMLSAWIVHHLDVYIVAGLGSDTDAGLYRVASRVAAIVSFALGFFMMAWSPLRRTSLFRALEGEARHGWFNATMVTYFFVVCMGLLVVLGVAAQFLVRIAGPAYADAATLIPLLGLALVAYGCFIVMIRVVKLPNHARSYAIFAVLSTVVFAVVALVLTPPLGAEGTALAQVVGYSVGIVVVGTSATRSGSLPAIRWWKVAVSAGTACACVAVAALLAPHVGSFEPVVDALVIVAYPVAMVVTGVLDREHLAPLRRAARGVLIRRPEPLGLRDGLSSLPSADRSLVESLLRHRRPLADVAGGDADDEAKLHADFTAVLRRLADVPGHGERDAEIGAYLLSQAPIADRDTMARRLWSWDVEPAELHALEVAAAALAADHMWREDSELEPRALAVADR